MDKLHVFLSYALNALDVAFRGNNYDRKINGGLAVSDIVDHLFAIHDGHVDINQSQIDPFIIQDLESLSPV
jgi:hypothetical protein